MADTNPVITGGAPTYGAFITPVGTGLGPMAQPYEVVNVGDLIRASRNEINAAATKAGPAQQTVAGLNSAIPIIYGRTRVGAKITAAIVYNSNLILRCVWCIGEVDQVVGLYLNDEPLPSTCTATHYVGAATQGVDPTLQAAFAASGRTYSDTLAGDGATRPGVCYSVVVIPPGVSGGFPRLVADVKGMKVRSTEGGARGWSENPAYVLADFMTSTTYGMGRTIDWAGIATLAANAAQTVGGEARRIIGLLMSNPLTCEAWLKVICEYAACWAIHEGAGYRFVANAMPTAGSGKTITGITAANPPRITSTGHGLSSGAVVVVAGVSGMTQINSAVGVVSYVNADSFDLLGINASAYSAYTSGGTATQIETSLMSFGVNNIAADSLTASKRGILQAPTVVEVGYTDTSVTPWREGVATAYADGVLGGTVPRRVSRLAMPGINRHSEANRYAIERLNSLQLCDLTVQFTTFDTAISLQVGDLIDVTHPVGLTAKVMRVTRAEPIEPGRWSIRANEFDPAVYSDSVVAGPTTSDTTLPSPTAPPAVTGLTLVEDVYQIETGRWASRIRVSWATPDYPFVASYAVETQLLGEVVDAAVVPTGITTYVTPPLAENKLYQVRVFVVSTLGAQGAAALSTITNDGKTARPSDVPSIEGYEIGGEVRLRWTPGVDLDLTAHELRYSVVGGSWSAALLLDRVPAPSVTYVTRSIAPGTWRFWIKALDSVRTATYPAGQESLNPAYVDITVTTDANAYVAASQAFSSPTLTNMSWGGPAGWVTDMGDVWGYSGGSGSGYTGPYDDMTDGEVRIYEGTPYNYGTVPNEPPVGIDAYSGVVMMPTDGKLLLFGGGHLDYWGNEVWELNVDGVPAIGNIRSGFVRHYAPDEGPVANDGSAGDNALIARLDADSDPINASGQRIGSGRPISRHTQSSLVWIDNISRMFAGGGSYYSGTGEVLWNYLAGHWGNGFADQWLYNPAVKTWQFVGVPMTLPWDGSTNPSALKSSNILSPTFIFYNPNDSGVWALGDQVHHTMGVSVLRFDTSTNTWSSYANSAIPNGQSYARAHAWLSVARNSLFMLLYDATNKYLYEYPCATAGQSNNWTLRSLSGSPPTLPTSGDVCEASCTAYSTYSNKLLLYTRAANTIYRINTTSWAWETAKTSAFSPYVHQCFGMTWDSTRDVGFFVYRNNGSGGSLRQLDFAAFRA